MFLLNDKVIVSLNIYFESVQVTIRISQLSSLLHHYHHEGSLMDINTEYFIFLLAHGYI